MDLPEDALPAPAAPAAFVGSRALHGANRHYAVPAVLLQPLGAAAQDGAAQGRWMALVVDMARALGWPDPQPRVHAPGGAGPARTWLAFAAPASCLGTACAVNEWAWVAAAQLGLTQRSAHPLGPDPVVHFRALAAAESRTPGAQQPDSVAAQPPPSTLLITGIHGKTTVLRLLAAVAREAGQDTRLVELPEHSLLAQGLLVALAQVAVLTDVSVGALQTTLPLVEQGGVQGRAQRLALDEQAATLLVAAHAVAGSGTLVLSGDDADLLRVALGQAQATAPSWALFSRDHATPLLDALRRHGGSTCAPRAGRLVLASGGAEHDLGAVADMPLSLGGHAAQNVANLAAAALAAVAAGWPLEALKPVLLRFGARPEDNPGRLERWQHRGATVLIDSARDGDSLAQLLKLAGALGARRVGLLLGVAPGLADPRGEALGTGVGAATETESEAEADNQLATALAQAAAAFKPDRVLITEAPALPHRQGAPAVREPGLLPLLLEQGLRAGGLSSRALRHEHDPEAAARALLAWAKAGDVVLLPVHTAALQERLRDLLGQPRAGAGLKP